MDERWVVPIIKLGNKRALGEKDLYKIPTEDESEVLGQKLHRSLILIFTCHLYLYIIFILHIYTFKYFLYIALNLLLTKTIFFSKREWMKEVVKCGNLRKRKRPSLVNAFFSMFGKKYILLGLQAFVEECIIKYIKMCTLRNIHS